MFNAMLEPNRFQSTAERNMTLSGDPSYSDDGLSPDMSVMNAGSVAYTTGNSLYGYERSNTLRQPTGRKRRDSYQEGLRFSGLQRKPSCNGLRTSNLSRLSRESRAMSQPHANVRQSQRRPSLLNGAPGSARNSLPAGHGNFTTGISLQVQQWKTIHEFESDEQQKYLVYSSLKLNSLRIWHLSLLSIVLMVADIELGIYATKTTNYMVERFVPPNCWRGVMGDTNKALFLEFTRRLFLSQSDSALPNYMLQSGQMDVISNEIYFGKLEGQYSGLLSQMTEIWDIQRGNYTFEPIDLNDETPLREVLPVAGFQMSKQLILYSMLGIRGMMSFVTLCLMIYLYRYFDDIRKLHIGKKRLPEQTGFWHATKACVPFLFHGLLTVVHVPPITALFNVTTRPFQLIVFLRIYHYIKKLREHHPMRYNRMTEILCTISSITLRGQFLTKELFLNNPIRAIFTIYLATIVTCTYSIYAIERSSGYCLSLVNALWVVLVTTTNLGYGDVMVSHIMSKALLQCTSIVGVVEMALLVNYVSSALVLPADERRIIGFFDKHRTLQLQRIAASNLIKSRWRLYRAKCKINDVFSDRFNAIDESGRGPSIAEQGTIGGPRVDFERILKMHMHEAKIYEIDYQHYYHHWLKIKSQAAIIHHNLAKGFTQEDTAIQATYISRKLDDLEQLIHDHSKERRNDVATQMRQNSIVHTPSPQSKSIFKRATSYAFTSPTAKSRKINSVSEKIDVEKEDKGNSLDPKTGNIKDLKKETIQRRWKRIVRHGIPEEKQESPWITSANPFDALARQSKMVHKQSRFNAMLNKGRSDEDLHVEQLLQDEEIRRNQFQEKQMASQEASEEHVAMRRIERLEETMENIANSLSLLIQRLDPGGGPLSNASASRVAPLKGGNKVSAAKIQAPKAEKTRSQKKEKFTSPLAYKKEPMDVIPGAQISRVESFHSESLGATSDPGEELEESAERQGHGAKSE